MSKQGRRKVYVGRVHLGRGKYKWVGRFPTRRQRDDAVARVRAELGRGRDADTRTVQAQVDAFLADYRETHKPSSYDAARGPLQLFAEEFGQRPLRSITRPEAIDYARSVPRSRIPIVVQMFNAAVDEERLERNPFRGLTKRTKGRSAQNPPTAEELSRLLDACSVHGWYAPQMRALVQFAAYTGMRRGELFALEWSDIDFEGKRIYVQRRVYKGRLDLPKSNKVRRIALTPSARDALLGHPRDGALVFRAKQGKRFSEPTLSEYWRLVKARAGLEFDFYLATKHYAVHYLFRKLRLSDTAIAEQMGWSRAATGKLLDTYGHGHIDALEEIDAAFENNVTPLRAVESDAS
jgi:integrase